MLRGRDRGRCREPDTGRNPRSGSGLPLESEFGVQAPGLIALEAPVIHATDEDVEDLADLILLSLAGGRLVDGQVGEELAGEDVYGPLDLVGPDDLEEAQDMKLRQ